MYIRSMNIYLEPEWVTSIFEGQPPQNKAEIPTKTRVISYIGHRTPEASFSPKVVALMLLCNGDTP